MNDIEIKLRALEIAKDISVYSFFNRKEIDRLNWEMKANHAENIGKTINKWESKNQFPDENEVINRAKAFNDFIFG